MDRRYKTNSGRSIVAARNQQPIDREPGSNRRKDLGKFASVHSLPPMRSLARAGPIASRDDFVGPLFESSDQNTEGKLSSSIFSTQKRRSQNFHTLQSNRHTFLTIVLFVDRWRVGSSLLRFVHQFQNPVARTHNQNNFAITCTRSAICRIVFASINLSGFPGQSGIRSARDPLEVRYRRRLVAAWQQSISAVAGRVIGGVVRDRRRFV